MDRKDYKIRKHIMPYWNSATALFQFCVC